ncbi:hypothetical protein ACI2OX_18540 [Bacillus sp. N9]
MIISAVIAFGSQFEGLIPFDKIFKGMGELIRTGYLLLTFIVFILLLFAWIISVIIAYLKYNDFTLKKWKKISLLLEDCLKNGQRRFQLEKFKQ